MLSQKLKDQSHIEHPLSDKAAQARAVARHRWMAAAEGRLLKIDDEFSRAFDWLEKYPLTVTFFGSARLPQDHPASVMAHDAAYWLSKAGYAIVTGGGGGIMEAANHGAHDAGGGSVGLNIQLPMEQALNPYLTDNYGFDHFFARKVLLTIGSQAYVFGSGGFGTLDELFEIITLAQTGKLPKAPIILMGDKFWKPLDKYIRQVLLTEFETISPGDLDLYHITEDLDEITQIIQTHTASV